MPQVFFLTSSSRGLGHQIAEAALAAGHQLVATARRPETLADLAGRYGSRILPVGLDVTDADAAAAAVSAGAEAFGRIDVVVKQRRLRRPRVGRGHDADGLPGAGRREPVRRGERDQGGVAAAARAG